MTLVFDSAAVAVLVLASLCVLAVLFGAALADLYELCKRRFRRGE